MSLAIRTRKPSFVRLQKKKLLQLHGICFRVPLAFVYKQTLNHLAKLGAL